MRTLLSALAASVLLGFGSQAEAFNENVCSGPAGDHNPHCYQGSGTGSVTEPGTVSVVPEPGAFLLFALGAAWIAGRRRRSRS
jgi:PEP-CTERM motif